MAHTTQSGYTHLAKKDLVKHPEVEKVIQELSKLIIDNSSLTDVACQVLKAFGKPLHKTILCGVLLVKGVNVKGVTIRDAARNVRIEPWDVLETPVYAPSHLAEDGNWFGSAAIISKLAFLTSGPQRAFCISSAFQPINSRKKPKQFRL